MGFEPTACCLQNSCSAVELSEHWLADQDSNLNKQIQSLPCYHYTIRQRYSRRESNPLPRPYKDPALTDELRERMTGRDRTCDIPLRRRMLYPLSYGHREEGGGFEPPNDSHRLRCSRPFQSTTLASFRVPRGTRTHNQSVKSRLLCH